MASIRKRTLPSGKTSWLCDYRDQAGVRRYAQFPTKREADAFLVRARADVAAGTHTPDSQSTTIAEAADLWLLRCERDGLEESTLRQYRAHVSLHILPFIGTTKLSRLSAPAVNGFLDQLMAAGRSREMARRVRGSLSSIVKHAQGRGLVAANHVLSSATIKRSKREDARPEMPTKAELQAIIAGAPDRHRPFVLTAILTGLRGSELRGLMWSDVDLIKSVLTVRRRVDRFNKFGPPKSETGTRDIPMAPLLCNTLKEWHRRCPAGELKLVFPTGAGNVESHGNLLRRVLWPIQVAAGVTAKGKAKFSLHAFRHAAAALFIEQGFGPKKVQTLMGHASIQQTFDTYGYLFESEEDDQRAVKAIAARLVIEANCYTDATSTENAERDQRVAQES